MTKAQAQKMVAMLDSLTKLAVLPLLPDFYRPEEECEQDVENIVRISTLEGDERDSHWAKIEILPESSWEAKGHFDRIWETLTGLDGLEIITSSHPSSGDEVPHIIVDLAKNDHIRGAF